MLSRFSQSIGHIMRSSEKEDVYTTSVDQEFRSFFLTETELSLCEAGNDLALNPSYYLTQNISLRTLYQIDKILDQIEYGDLTAELAASLMSACAFLRVNSSSTFICLDDGFSYAKKYTLLNDAYSLASSMHKMSSILEDISKGLLPGPDISIIPKFKELDARLCCKYIRSNISVVKLFHIMAILQTSPYYSNGTHQIAKQLIQSLREVLYNKRILSVTVDSNTKGLSNKPHKSTRLKIIFALGNSDRYCIRLDFPHQGVDCIHLNLNQPAREKSTGFPFGMERYYEARSACADEDTFNSLFYLQDDLYWFRSDYSSKIREIGRTNPEKERSLEQFFAKRVHLEIFPSDTEHKEAVSEFSEAFAEAMTEFGFRFNYDSTDSEDDPFYRYLLLQDAIFAIVSNLRATEISKELGISWGYSDSIQNEQDWEILDSEVKKGLFKRIKQTFADDKALVTYIAQDPNLVDFFSKCLDRIDEVGL